MNLILSFGRSPMLSSRGPVHSESRQTTYGRSSALWKASHKAELRPHANGNRRHHGRGLNRSHGRGRAQQVRKFGEKTQTQYVRAVRQFAKYLGRSPETASVEELRNYQLHLVDRGTSPASLNSAICGLKFFVGVTLDRPEAMANMKPVHLPRKLPDILSPDEVKRLIAAAGNLKHQLHWPWPTRLACGSMKWST